MTGPMTEEAMAVLERLVGVPVVVEELKHKPGRRTTRRASGPDGSAVVKVYASPRAAVVADRIGALSRGPSEPVVPRVLHVGADGHLLVLSHVPGDPFARAILAADLLACTRTGNALGRWHHAWMGGSPSPLRAHTVERELEILRSRAEASSPALAEVVREQAALLDQPWPAATVVHRDLYEEQVVLDEAVGLIDLDDAALGPPELDIGNLLAHVELLARGRQRDLTAPVSALLEGYAQTGLGLESRRLEQCRRLSLLRLACIHDEPELIGGAGGLLRAASAPARPASA